MIERGRQMAIQPDQHGVAHLPCRLSTSYRAAKERQPPLAAIFCRKNRSRMPQDAPLVVGCAQDAFVLPAAFGCRARALSVWPSHGREPSRQRPRYRAAGLASTGGTCTWSRGVSRLAWESREGTQRACGLYSGPNKSEV